MCGRFTQRYTWSEVHALLLRVLQWATAGINGRQ